VVATGFQQPVPFAVEVQRRDFVQRHRKQLRAHCAEADRSNRKKRFPAWDTVPTAQVNRTETRLQQLVQLIADVESSGKRNLLGQESETESLTPGTLVHNPILGVTMMGKDAAYPSYPVVNLSHSPNELVKFGALVTPVLFNGKPYELFQRTEAFTIRVRSGGT